MKKIILTISLITIIFSCSKNDESISAIKDPVVQSSPEKLKPSINELQEKAEQLSQILQEVYQNADALKELNEAIYTEYYSDERVALKDLLNPDESELYNTSKSLRSSSIKSSFKEAFEEIVDKKLDKNSRTSGEDFEDYLIKNGVSIYFPYSDNFKNKAITSLTIVVPKEKETDEGNGTLVNGINKKTVIVNDEYAKKYPTHIIVAEAKKAQKNTNSIDKNVKIAAVNRVYFGQMAFRRQYDPLIGFFNSGGPDFKLFRISGYLSVVGGAVTAPAADTKPVDPKRGDINTNIDVFWLWDTDWVTANTNQVLAIYEDDDSNKDVTFTGTIGTTLKTSATSSNTTNGSIGYTMKFKSDDEIIKQVMWNRSSFYSSNGTAAGWGTRGYTSRGLPGPFAIYDNFLPPLSGNNNSVSYTLPTQMIP